MSGCSICRSQSCYCRPKKQDNREIKLAKDNEEYIKAVIKLTRKVNNDQLKEKIND